MSESVNVWIRVQCVQCGFIARTENMTVGGTYEYTFAHGYLDQQCKRCTASNWYLKMGVTEANPGDASGKWTVLGGQR